AQVVPAQSDVHFELRRYPYVVLQVCGPCLLLQGRCGIDVDEAAGPRTEQEGRDGVAGAGLNRDRVLAGEALVKAEIARPVTGIGAVLAEQPKPCARLDTMPAPYQRG